MLNIEYEYNMNICNKSRYSVVGLVERIWQSGSFIAEEDRDTIPIERMEQSNQSNFSNLNDVLQQEGW